MDLGFLLCPKKVAEYVKSVHLSIWPNFSLSVCKYRPISRITHPDFTKFSVAVSRYFYVGIAICYVLLVLWTMSYFPTTGPIAA